MIILRNKNIGGIFPVCCRRVPSWLTRACPAAAVQVNMRGQDGQQGPMYVGTGCVFRRAALYGADPPPKDKARPRSCCAGWCFGSRTKKNNKVSAGEPGAANDGEPAHDVRHETSERDVIDR